MRELVKMLSDSDTLDDLGIGRFGTRRRLAVPWNLDGSDSGALPAVRAVDLQARRTPAFGRRAGLACANEERQLVNVLSSEGATDGLIGRRAGSGEGAAVEHLLDRPEDLRHSACRRPPVRAATDPSIRPHEDGPDEAGSSDCPRAFLLLRMATPRRCPEVST
ncbi:hypothetical protein GS416_09860 [Rhodococcus hoagii]|nr:hypothetical protein [Prescottella equi]